MKLSVRISTLSPTSSRSAVACLMASEELSFCRAAHSRICGAFESCQPRVSKKQGVNEVSKAMLAWGTCNEPISWHEARPAIVVFVGRVVPQFQSCPLANTNGDHAVSEWTRHERDDALLQTYRGFHQPPGIRPAKNTITC